MATIRIRESRRTGVDRCDFVVQVLDGSVVPGDFFACHDVAGPFEYRVISTEPHPLGALLHCFNWILSDGQFVGDVVPTVEKSAREVARYDRHMRKAGIKSPSDGKSS